jgi:hypothetical protein
MPVEEEGVSMGVDRMARVPFAPVLFAALSALTPIRATAAAAPPINILFIGNSFTHGRYEPVRTYNGGFGANDVHDLLCSSPAACSSAEQITQVDPAKTPPPGATLAAQLADLQANPSLQYNEPGPYGGVAGIPAVYPGGAPQLFGLVDRGKQRHLDRLSQQYRQRKATCP